ncbi:MAG TPA: hypothetical protein VM639_02900 [Dongiaceae bacterium]|nr:hypothetical protein [Dongiaceae bacterium]
MGRPAKTADRAKATGRKHTEELLDEALADTFPASDPVEMLEPAARNRGRAAARTAGKKTAGKNKPGKKKRE